MEENKMGVMKENKLLITMAVPMVISMLVQALYNIVDSVFVSMINENALTAVSIAFTMQNLMIAVASGLSVGMNSVLSRSLGQRDFKLVNKSALNGIFLEMIGCAIFIVLGFSAVRLFFAAQAGTGENAGQIIDYGVQYLSIVLIFSLGLFAQMTFERLLQSTGQTIYTMVTQGTGAIINIILDPIFIFVFKWGIAGAAIATVAGQFIAAAMALVFNIKKNNEINLSVKGFKPEWHIIKQILFVGIPSMIMVSIGSVMTFCMNKILVRFSSTAVAVFGAYFKINSFIFMPLFGMNNGMVPIIAYNYGAGKKSRITKTVRLAATYAFAIMVVGTIIFQLFPKELLGMFNASPQMLKIGEPALRIISLSFPFASFCIVASSMFQALGNGTYSMMTSFARQLLALVPSAFILATIVGFNVDRINIVWWSYIIAEAVSLLLSLLLFIRIYNKKIKNLKPLEEKRISV